VVDFDSLPSDAAERLTLVRFRIKKSVPFDVESAAVGYYVQQSPGNRKKFDVVVAVVPLEIVARYEAPFRAAGFHTGLVTTSTLAALKLVQPCGISVVAKLSGRILTISVLQQSVLKLIRCVELSDISLAEILSYLYPTFAYTEDQLGAKPEKLYLCGMDALHGEAVEEQAPPVEMPAAEPVCPPEQEQPDRWTGGQSDIGASEPVDAWATGPEYTPDTPAAVAEQVETPPAQPPASVNFAPPSAQTLLGRELGVPVELLRSRFATPGESDAGLLGYLESMEGF